MKKYLLKSSLHDGKEIVVLIEDIEKSKQQIESLRKSMVFDFMRLLKDDGIEDKFLVDYILSAEELLFSQKDAIEKIKEEKDKFELGLISKEEFDIRKAEWSKYIR